VYLAKFVSFKFHLSIVSLFTALYDRDKIFSIMGKLSLLVKFGVTFQSIRCANDVLANDRLMFDKLPFIGFNLVDSVLFNNIMLLFSGIIFYLPL